MWKSGLVAICLLFLPASCQAKNNCPWLNEATASGLMGGTAVGDYTAAAPGSPAVCAFVRQDAGATRTLRIAVEIAPEPHARFAELAQVCAVPTALKAIGNEAVECAADDRRGGMGQRAVSRVRDQVFTITISSSLKDDPELTRDALQSKIGVAAEQVAGNLF